MNMDSRRAFLEPERLHYFERNRERGRSGLQIERAVIIQLFEGLVRNKEQKEKAKGEVRREIGRIKANQQQPSFSF